MAHILATRNLGLDIGGATIVADVGLEVRAGEFLGIIGPNGAGKTSLFNLLSGLYRPTHGTIEMVTPACSIPQSVPPSEVSVREADRISGRVNLESVFIITSAPRN